MTYKFSEKVSHLQASAIREILKFTSDPEVISFAAGNPSPEAFPVDELNRISEEIFKKNPNRRTPVQPYRGIHSAERSS